MTREINLTKDWQVVSSMKAKFVSFNLDGVGFIAFGSSSPEAGAKGHQIEDGSQVSVSTSDAMYARLGDDEDSGVAYVDDYNSASDFSALIVPISLNVGLL